MDCFDFGYFRRIVLRYLEKHTQAKVSDGSSKSS